MHLIAKWNGQTKLAHEKRANGRVAEWTNSDNNEISAKQFLFACLFSESFVGQVDCVSLSTQANTAGELQQQQPQHRTPLHRPFVLIVLLLFNALPLCLQCFVSFMSGDMRIKKNRRWDYAGNVLIASSFGCPTEYIKVCFKTKSNYVWNNSNSVLYKKRAISFLVVICLFDTTNLFSCVSR